MQQGGICHSVTSFKRGRLMTSQPCRAKPSRPFARGLTPRKHILLLEKTLLVPYVCATP